MIAGGNHTSIYEDSVPYSVLEENDKLKFESLDIFLQPAIITASQHKYVFGVPDDRLR